MHKFRVEFEMEYDGIVSVEHPDRPKSVSYLNALMREDVEIQVKDALMQYGFNPTINKVRKVNGNTNGRDA